MPAYWMGRVKVNNPDEYKKYADQVAAILAKYGGKFLPRGERFQIMEGPEKFNRFVVIEFPTFDQAIACRSMLSLSKRLFATTVPLLAFSCASPDAQQPPWKGCRTASKTEYESAKRDFLLQTSVGAYATTGHWWRRYYWYCHL